MGSRAQTGRWFLSQSGTSAGTSFTLSHQLLLLPEEPISSSFTLLDSMLLKDLRQTVLMLMLVEMRSINIHVILPANH